MRMDETKVAIGGLMRCCLHTLGSVPDDKVVAEGETLDCMYEAPGNKQMILIRGRWRWNSEGSQWTTSTSASTD